jgi:hypothetical protein
MLSTRSTGSVTISAPTSGPSIDHFGNEQIGYWNASQNFIPPREGAWTCHLWGSSEGNGFSWRPADSQVPNAFVRWMMKVCFACTWVRR